MKIRKLTVRNETEILHFQLCMVFNSSIELNENEFLQDIFHLVPNLLTRSFDNQFYNQVNHGMQVTVNEAFLLIITVILNGPLNALPIQLRLSGQVWWRVESSCAAKRQSVIFYLFFSKAILMTCPNWSCNLAA